MSPQRGRRLPLKWSRHDCQAAQPQFQFLTQALIRQIDGRLHIQIRVIRPLQFLEARALIFQAADQFIQFQVNPVIQQRRRDPERQRQPSAQLRQPIQFIITHLRQLWGGTSEQVARICMCQQLQSLREQPALAQREKHARGHDGRRRRRRQQRPDLGRTGGVIQHQQRPLVRKSALEELLECLAFIRQLLARVKRLDQLPQGLLDCFGSIRSQRGALQVDLQMRIREAPAQFQHQPPGQLGLAHAAAARHPADIRAALKGRFDFIQLGLAPGKIIDRFRHREQHGGNSLRLWA